MATGGYGTRPKTQRDQTKSTIHSSAEAAMQYTDAGYAFLIVTGKQHKPVKEKRSGAMRDVDNFNSVFRHTFGMTTQINKNNNHRQQLSNYHFDHNLDPSKIDGCKPNDLCICCQISKLDLSKADKVVLVISTHGKEDEGEPMAIMHDGSIVTRSDIINGIGDQRCPNMKGKMRVIIMCCCRTDKDKPERNKDRGVSIIQSSTGSGDLNEDFIDLDPKLNNDNGDSIRADGGIINVDDDADKDDAGDGSDTEDGSSTDDDNPDGNNCQTGTENTHTSCKDESARNENRKKYAIPPNFIFAYSTQSGTSLRSKKDGTYLMKELINAANDDFFGKTVNFLQLLTLTNMRVCKLSKVKHKHNKDGKQEKKRNERGDLVPIVDPVRSGFKNTICVEHRLIKMVRFEKIQTGAHQSSSVGLHTD